MTREPAPIVLHLSKTQLGYLAKVHVNGGQLGLQQALLEKVRPRANGEAGCEIALTDAEMGELIRHMGYGGGGWQSTLRKAFLTPIQKHCGAL